MLKKYILIAGLCIVGYSTISAQDSYYNQFSNWWQGKKDLPQTFPEYYRQQNLEYRKPVGYGPSRWQQWTNRFSNWRNPETYQEQEDRLFDEYLRARYEWYKPNPNLQQKAQKEWELGRTTRNLRDYYKQTPGTNPSGYKYIKKYYSDKNFGRFTYPPSEKIRPGYYRDTSGRVY